MHKIKLNSFVIDFSILPKSPILIKAGGISANPSLPDMQFVRTNIMSKGETIYIPGSSLKGVFRSFSEGILRSIRNEYACDPFDKDKNCSRNLEKKERSGVIYRESCHIYRESCHICKVFGSQKLKGRIFIKDAYPNGEVKIETRQGVAISRQTQAVAAGPFDMETAISGRFKTRLTIENFECWQIGIIALSINALKTGWLKIGFGKNRGFGLIDVEIHGIDFIFMKPAVTDMGNLIWGIGKSLNNDDQRKRYGLNSDDFCELEEPILHSVEEAVFIRKSYHPSDWDKISERFIKVLEDTFKK